MKTNPNRLLAGYAALLTVAMGVTIGVTVTSTVVGATDGKTTFEEIDVQRINLREPDGTLRLIISNEDRWPGLIIRGEERPHPSGRRTAGILFFNEEGTENGGLTFRGKTGPDGTVSGGGHLSFDQYEQDQVIQLTQSEHDGARWAALVISDRPDGPLALDLAEKIVAMPDGPEKTTLLEKVREEGTFGRQRMYVGKTRNRESAVMMNDAKGRPRMLLKVSPDGAASIDFLDGNGEVVRSITPESD